MTRSLSLAALLLLSGCGGKADAPVGEGKAGGEDAPVARVRVAPATLGVTGDLVTAHGTTEAGPGAGRSLIAPAEAIVAAVLAPTGTAVHTGQAIVTLHPSRTSQLETAAYARGSAAARRAGQRCGGGDGAHRGRDRTRDDGESRDRRGRPDAARARRPRWKR